ncbi:MAG: GAF domain-containing protein [Betaproteobacteria bacterium]|nr:MAG: GAF domain-containing protein [Betaproteobacteria bacterium]
MKARRAKRSSPARKTTIAQVRARLRRVEKGLRQVEQRYELVMGAINESVYDWDIAHDRFSVSESMQRVLGLPAPLLSLAEWHKRIHPDDYARYRAATVAHLKGITDRFEFDYRFRDTDGAWRWARTHGLAIRDAKGRAVRMIGSTGDITELKHAEDALRTSEERYALATAAAVEGIYEWDIDTGSLYLTDRARAFFAFPDQDVTPAAWNARIHGEDYPRYRAAIAEHFKGRTEYLEMEYRIADASGGYKWVLDRGKAVRDANGRATKMVGALSDITQRKRAEIEVRAAHDEATEALRQQTAISEILRVISGSPSDVQPVFEAIVQAGTRLFEGAAVAVARPDGGEVRLMAIAERDPERAQSWRQRFPFPLSRDYMHGAAILDCKTVEIPDAQEADGNFDAGKRNFAPSGYRAMTVVPMIRDGAAIGAISVIRKAPGPLSEKQVALLKTFADQAVIAIENIRLLNETKEALERQTATAEILRVISSTPTDAQPVFDAIAQSGLRVFAGTGVGIALVQGERVRVVSAGGDLGVMATKVDMPLSRESASGTSIVDRTVVNITDTEAPDAPRYARDNGRALGFRCIACAPMLREGIAIGAIVVTLQHAGGLSDAHLELLKTFADQAVIAIENVRLFNETTEALDQQKASAEVLGAISRSIADTAPVFDKILESCERLFAGRIVGLNLVREDGRLHIGAYHGAHRDEFERIFPLPVSAESGSGLSIVERRVVHFPDIEHGEDVPASTKQGCKAIGIKSVIFAPMLWEGRGMGAIFVGRDHVSSFSESEIALLKTFAGQAAIAIENVRLFKAIEEKSRQLEIANRHKSEFLANMSHELRTPLNAIIGFTRIVMRRSKEQLEQKQYENLDKILSSAQHLLALINAILDLSKVEAGHVEVHAGDVQLGPVLEQCMKTVEPLVKAPAVRLLKDFDGGLPQVYADEEKLRQIVLNLLGNAVKFTEQGTVRVRAKADGDSFSVAVTDTGIGIPADKLEHVFEEFTQADASSTRVYGGTGLGLTIARRLARLMGGDIAVESAPGAGSTFTLTLPLRYQA